MNSQQNYTTVRRWPRALADIRVNFRLTTERPDVPGEQRAWARSRDISEGGLALYSVLDMSVDDRLELDFELPEIPGRVKVRGVIRNHSGFRYGIEFLLLDRADRERISEFVAARKAAFQAGI